VLYCTDYRFYQELVNDEIYQEFWISNVYIFLRNIP